MLGANFAEVEQSRIEALLNEVSIINKARFNYNLELHRFFSDGDKKSEITEFWQSICSFKINEKLAKCFDEFHIVTKAKVNVYLQIQKKLSREHSEYDDISLIDLYVYIKIVTNNTKSQEDRVLKLYEKDLRAAKLKSGERKKDWDTFNDITKEYPYLNKMSSLLEEFIRSKGKLYAEFLKQITVGDCIHSLSEYNPTFFYTKKTKKIIILLDKLRALDGNFEDVKLILSELCEIEDLLNFQINRLKDRVEDENLYQNIQWQFEHFSLLYSMADRIDLAETKINDFIVKYKGAESNCKKPIQPKPKCVKARAVMMPPCSIVERPPLNPEHASIQNVTPSSDKQSQSESSSSREEMIVSLTDVFQELEELSLSDVACSKSEEVSSASLSSQWDEKKKKRDTEKRLDPSTFSPQSENPILIEMAKKLNKKGQADTLRDLFRESIHKKFSFKELMDLVITCGGKVENVGGSVRRIILGKFASDTLDMPSKNVKLNVHAPHQKYNEKDRLPSCIAKHFQCVFMQAGITPQALFSEDMDLLRTPKVLKAPKL